MMDPVWRRALSSVLVAAAVTALPAGCTGGRTEQSATRPSVTSPPKAPSAATVTRVIRISPRLRDLVVRSPALDAEVKIRLLLPVRYEAQPNRRWPVLYLLHGCCDSYESWTRSSDVETLTARSDLLVVMPDGGRVGFYSNWQRGPQWETFHLTELREILERDYRASTVRAIAGLSMGGLGALDYAARHPGLFRAAASFSGVTHTRLSPNESAFWLSLARSQAPPPGSASLSLWGDPVTDASLWAEHNPYDLAPRLRGLAIFVSCGSGVPGPLDPPREGTDPIESRLIVENTAFSSRLQILGIPARIDLYGPGTHNWPYWQRELHRAWPMLASALGLSSDR
jgi:S-formylglutathione hydrolase FrmB